MAGDGEKKAVLEMVQADGADEGCVTFVLHDEDHTLGNSLRYMIMKNGDVEFCGYTITHPSESKINFRIQTRGFFFFVYFRGTSSHRATEEGSE
ncbi:DNA-directed RNA polymerases I and III subunit RPAC2 isoform X2 [Cheilinus undulatus]|uniref:DNA-directed RNA polymerases I and III subunit RPAC2 isoform X2 n=1 Tax=Cheilinus undulatus TaxID=241271 RepID=UPI001BD5935F|nr:DNA-directed RNA polymerases I and III subunit RPAC2 isoform X2 [Cheilinus undulatus]